VIELPSEVGSEIKKSSGKSETKPVGNYCSSKETLKKETTVQVQQN
jgi:hypothetical protein